MLKPRDLNGGLPSPIQVLLRAAVATQAVEQSIDLHPEVLEATDPDDIWKRKNTDDVGIRVFRDYTTNRHYLVALGVHDRQTMMSGMAFEKRPMRALIMYCELAEGQIKLWEKKTAKMRKG